MPNRAERIHQSERANVPVTSDLCLDVKYLLVTPVVLARQSRYLSLYSICSIYRGENHFPEYIAA